MPTATSTAISKDGTSIVYDKVGEGPVLVFVDGATAVRAYDVSLANVLAAEFTVVSYDRRGRGESGDTLPYAVEREFEDLDAVIAANGGSAYVFGQSSGAVLALRAAAAGLPITKLAVYEPPFLVNDARPPLPADYVEHLDELVAAGKRGDAYAYFMTTAVGMPAEMVDSMRGEPFWPAMEEVAHTIAYDGRIMGDTMRGNPLSPEPWSRVTAPTLVLAGGASPEFMRDGARALADIVPDATFRVLEGQEHGAADDVLAPELVSFFKG
jgi:pimeloyl-ACP methyl ester carboxylesterase